MSFLEWTKLVCEMSDEPDFSQVLNGCIKNYFFNEGHLQTRKILIRQINPGKFKK